MIERISNKQMIKSKGTTIEPRSFNKIYTLNILDSGRLLICMYEDRDDIYIWIHDQITYINRYQYSVRNNAVI